MSAVTAACHLYALVLWHFSTRRTGCFLVVSASSYLLNEGGAVAFMQLIPLDMGVADGCTDPCVCDGNGAVGGTCKLSLCTQMCTLAAFCPESVRTWH